MGSGTFARMYDGGFSRSSFRTEGKLLIDGKPLKAEYVSDIGYAGTASEPVHLGKDEYFLLGDNETASDDSREEKIGNIKKKEIYGEVWFVIKPWSDIGFVSD